MKKRTWKKKQWHEKEERSKKVATKLKRTARKITHTHYEFQVIIPQLTSEGRRATIKMWTCMCKNDYVYWRYSTKSDVLLLYFSLHSYVYSRCLITPVRLIYRIQPIYKTSALSIFHYKNTSVAPVTIQLMNWFHCIDFKLCVRLLQTPVHLNLRLPTKEKRRWNDK